MANAKQKDFSMNDFEAKYHEITALYDHAEALVATVESDFVQDPNLQLEIVEPLIMELGDAADVLGEEFMLIAESRRFKHSNKASKARIEASLRKVFVAVSDYQARVRDIGKKAHGAIQNIADPIVQKIQRALEEIVVIFLELIQISLLSIMGKTELEALRVRDTRIAMMMHQQAMQQQ